ncbi:fumarylacetoacetate hydrolase [Anaerobacillus alkalidiazotrophicus]|uniref:Fumarylacetoacetate hydrolase n=1 Tax=Anaerobacillus alkalidiazotrophicus TaxID=472963 RepID=A0A1S2M057_9BACI|nr:fumarylacetoacetate hydrolase family protein [Anaerobacillus alkalidiazotrophicus]OIJ18081.1 fumarylacetoacetate hydrolase [Anaerobacillus alkalidiazotrophicus]OIJ19560.1 fumarylacetoacetate hydrolase [Anaerobacillus alkalidiazotrophicus]
MKLATIKHNDQELAAVFSTKGIVLLETINQFEGLSFDLNLFNIIEKGQLNELIEWYQNGGKERLETYPMTLQTEVEYAPLYRNPRKIWGIGMNYVTDLIEIEKVNVDDDPVSFFKPDTTLIGPNDHIILPEQSERTTAEGELAIIIGKRCKNISEDEVEDVIAGYTTALDMTASDIHAINPRFLARAKSFDTFFSFGPQFLTKDEVRDLANVNVATVLNGETIHEKSVSYMKFPPAFLISFHSKVMTLLPGDIIMTGTPGSTVIRDGDIVECHIDGLEALKNQVVRYS